MIESEGRVIPLLSYVRRKDIRPSSHQDSKYHLQIDLHMQIEIVLFPLFIIAIIKIEVIVNYLFVN